jgi:hypothetical protein
MRVLRLIAVGALIAVGVIAWLSTSVTPTTSPFTESRALAVACFLPAQCVAVGSTDNGYSVDAPFAVLFANDVWTIRAPRAPSQVGDSVLSSVACVPPDSCIAVGLQDMPAPFLGAKSAGDRPLIESWDGTTWRSSAGSIPPGTTDAELNGVACAVSSCMAVGEYSRKSGGDRALAESWDGAAWTLRLPPRLRSIDDMMLQDVACVSPTSCTAVGRFSHELQEVSSTTAPLVETWDGTEWRIERSVIPKGSLDTELNAVACPTPSRCVAVGFQRGPGGRYSTFAEIRRGTTWRMLPTPDPAGSPYAKFSDLACPRADRCIAVGWSASGTNLRSLVELWDGTRWTVVRTPTPATSTSSVLTAIDCVDLTHCYAVGIYQKGTPTEHAFSESWDGAGWTIVPIPLGSSDVSASCAISTQQRSVCPSA